MIPDYDPVLIALVRQTIPNLMAYDICGVQPMTGPTGAIFALRPAYKLHAVPYHVAVERGFCLDLWYEMMNDSIIKDASYRKQRGN